MRPYTSQEQMQRKPIANIPSEYLQLYFEHLSKLQLIANQMKSPCYAVFSKDDSVRLYGNLEDLMRNTRKSGIKFMTWIYPTNTIQVETSPGDYKIQIRVKSELPDTINPDIIEVQSQEQRKRAPWYIL